MVVKNELPSLRVSLPLVTAQEIGLPYELVVVDSGSTDGSLELLERTARTFPGLRVVGIRPDEFHHARTRNLGVSFARGRYLVFLSGDAIPKDVRWLATLAAPVVAGSAAASFGRQQARPDADAANTCRMRFLYPGSAHEGGPLRSSRLRHSFSTVNCCIDRDAIGPPIFADVPVAEDTALAAKLIAAGGTIAYLPEAVVVHSHNHRCVDVFRRYFDAGLTYRRLGLFARGERAVIADGLRYLTSSLAFLVRRRPLAIPHFLAFFAFSAFGLILGRRRDLVPAGLRRRISVYGMAD